MRVACSQCGRVKTLVQLSAGLLCADCVKLAAKSGDCFGKDLQQSQCLFCFDRSDCGKVANADKGRRLKRRG